MLAAPIAAAVVYYRGWRQLQFVGDHPFPKARLAAFLAGLLTIYLGLASPLDSFSYFLLSIHMVQHDLLFLVAPPLIWLAEPELPLLLGMPATVRRYWLGPVLRSPTVRRFFTWLTHPKIAFVVFVVVLTGWHVPALYNATLRWPPIHDLEHACFFYVGLLFWWPILIPYPARPTWSRWMLLPYLFFAGMQGTALSLWLIFSSRVLYPHYDRVPRIAALPAMEDQSWAGALMLVPGSLIGIAAAIWVTLQLLQPRPARSRSTSRQVAQPAPIDLLNIPVLSRLLHSRYARVAVQVPTVAVAALIVLDGLCGPQMAPMNFAGIAPWIVWRGLLILSLVTIGNIFCFACPFMLPRKIGKRVAAPRRPWPSVLRNKWLAATLVVVFFWAYETFSVWDRPGATAWIIIAYFAGALVIDTYFRGAAFCKYVCPVGQFNFGNSCLSPTEVRVKSHDLCRTCRTHDCILGRGGIPGCELDLYQPRKGSNLDCTYCLDCVHACPYGNVGLLAVTPGRDLLHDYSRSSLRRIHLRPDLAVLVGVLTFGAFVNAAAMVAPVLRVREYVSTWWNLSSPVAATIFIAVALLFAPAVLVGAAAQLSRVWGKHGQPALALATRFAYALLPLGVGMWLAHYSFHLFTSFGAIISVLQRVAVDCGVGALGTPSWSHAGMLMVAGPRLLRFQVLSLDVGFLASLYIAWRLAREQTPALRAAVGLFAPWAALIGLLFCVGLWLLFQPMEMRGAMVMGD